MNVQQIQLFIFFNVCPNINLTFAKKENEKKKKKKKSSPDTRTGRTFAPNAHVEREQSLRHPPCPGGGGLCVPRHPDIETFYTKCANLSTVYTFTQSRHLHSPTNSASSTCLLTKCNILTHGRYLLSAYKARRPVYTSTQRRENLQSCLLQG